MRRIKVGDKVRVMAGKAAGKDGKILKVLNVNNKRGVPVTKVVVEGLNVVKKSQKPNPRLNIAGGIVEFEAPINISNVMLLEGDVPTRVRIKIDEKTGKKSRISVRSGKILA